MSVGEDDAEQFSLRWNNFHNNLTVGFHELLEEKDLVDVTLACDGKYVQAHKIVLSVCSPYFKSLFKENPCRHPIVILKDVGHKELQAILQFMYRGEVNVRQDDLTGFLKTAEMLKIKGLTGENSDKDSQKRALSEEKRRPRGVPTHCDDDSGSAPYKRIKSEQRRSRVVARPSSRPHTPIECIPPSSASREDIMHSGFDVTKPKEEPVDYSQVEDEYSSELAPSLPHEIEEGIEEMEGECTSVGGEGVGSESRGGIGSGRNHLPAEGGGDAQPTSALAAMAHLVHVGGPSSSEGGQQRQDSHGLEPKQMQPTMGLPPIGSGAVLEPNVALQVDSKERLQDVLHDTFVMHTRMVNPIRTFGMECDQELKNIPFGKSIQNTNMTAAEADVGTKLCIDMEKVHVPQKIPPTKSQMNPRKRCVVCWKNKQRRETSWQCTECKIGLHLTSCFAEFHQKFSKR